MGIEKNILHDLVITGLNFDNGYGFNDLESYRVCRTPLVEGCDYMRKHAYKLLKMAVDLTTVLGVSQKRTYISINGEHDYVLLSNSNHSYIKVFLCSGGDVEVFMGDENYLRPLKRYTDLNDMLKDEKILDIVKRFNEGALL